MLADQRIEAFPTVLVNGGRRGLMVELAPADLLRLTGAEIADVSSARQ